MVLKPPSAPRPPAIAPSRPLLAAVPSSSPCPGQQLGSSRSSRQKGTRLQPTGHPACGAAPGSCPPEGLCHLLTMHFCQCSEWPVLPCHLGLGAKSPPQSVPPDFLCNGASLPLSLLSYQPGFFRELTATETTCLFQLLLSPPPDRAQGSCVSCPRPFPQGPAVPSPQKVVLVNTC